MKDIKLSRAGEAAVACAATMLLVFSCGTSDTSRIPQETPGGPEKSSVPVVERPKGTLPAINNPLPAGRIGIMEDFEDGSFWYAAGLNDDEDYSIGAETTNAWASSGDTSGIWSFARIPEGSEAGWFCNNLTVKDFENASALLCDINNISQDTIAIYVQIETGDTHEKTATAPVFIGVGENTNVMFDLKHELHDVNGNSVYGITDAYDVRSIFFKVQGKAKAASFEIDNIRLSY